jgi:hypothetical protein
LALSSVPAARASTASCSSADKTLEEDKLDQARKEYLDVLASVPSSTCAADALQKVTQATRAETLLCSEGKLLAEAKQAQQARRRYVAALAKNIESKCASAGLGVSKKTAGDEKNSWPRGVRSPSQVRDRRPPRPPLLLTQACEVAPS